MKNPFACAAGVILFLSATGAVAADAPNHKKAPATEAPEADEPEDLSKFEINTALDVTSRRSTFVYSSITVAPFDILDKSGVRVKVEGVNGGYHYNTEGDSDFFQPPLLSIHGHSVGVSALVGYEYVTETLNLAGFVGADYQHDSETFNPANSPLLLVTDTDPSSSGQRLRNPTVGTRWGVKFATDIDYHPVEQWSFVLSGNYSTANNSWWSRLRPGYAVMPDVFVGPEVLYQGNNFYRQWRVGAHVRGLKLGALEIGLASGFMRDSVVSNGTYGVVEASIRF